MLEHATRTNLFYNSIMTFVTFIFVYGLYTRFLFATCFRIIAANVADNQFLYTCVLINVNLQFRERETDKDVLFLKSMIHY